jgi:hypothetical protein
VTERDPRSTAEWRRLTRQLTAAATHCAACGGELRKTDPPRTRWRPSVDHVLPVADHPHLAYTVSNLRVVHVGCNSRLSNVARRGHPHRIGGKPQRWRPRRPPTELPPSTGTPGPGW